MKRLAAAATLAVLSFAGYSDDLFDGARWIAAPAELKAAAPRFTTTFSVDRDGPAPIAICGLGQYVATLDGRPLGRGDEFNLPGWTRTSKTCFYNVFRPVLKAGAKHTLAITLGDGMYNVPPPGNGLYTKFTGSEGSKKLLVGGAVQSAPGAAWTVSPCDIVRTHVYSGDDIDRTADVARSVPAMAAEPPKGVLREAPFVCRLQETRKPVRTMRVSDDEFTVDFGQNAAYVPTVVARGPRGSRVEIEFSEIPLKEGETRITKRPGGYGRTVARCKFTLAGTGGAEEFTTPFFYYGFRYMKVRLVPAEKGGVLPSLESASARVVMADAPSAGSFKCSIPLFNQIHDICWWAQRSNMQSVFTDCPHREKLGWQEQNNLHSEQIRWGWDANAMYAKTCMDMADSQLPDGMVPDIAPEYVVFRGGFRHSIEWGSSMILIPWQQYEWTGDASLIREYWPNMLAYHNYIRLHSKNAKRGLFITAGGLGDWYQQTAGGNRPIRKTSIELTATAFYYLNATTLAKCADLLGKKDEATAFREEAANIKKAFNAKWWRPDVHGYENNSQTANSMALHLGLSDPAETSAIVSNIVEDVRGRGNAVGTGEIGYPFLLKVLADHGHSDVIFDMTADCSKPGYGYMVAKGNTTCHEAWDCREGSSFNHFMMADIVSWFYTSLAGIKPVEPGFRKFEIAPEFLPGLDWVKAHHSVSTGDIRVEWRRKCDEVTVTVDVPPRTCATVRLGWMAPFEQQPGRQTYTWCSRVSNCFRH